VNIKERLKDIDEQISILRKARREVLSKCECENMGKGMSAQCQDCGSTYGWRCEGSPDSECHYYSRPGLPPMGDEDPHDEQVFYVTLRGGKMHPLPEAYNPMNESYDWCIFCGEPEDRQ
jgi:hypothetical protein